MTIDPGEVLSPSQLNTLARNLLEDSFPSIWVEGELGNITRPSSGHLYFTLKDARAQIRCAMFKPKSQWLRFVPREGLRVLARGRLTLYEARGDYQLVLEHAEEAGEGALRRAFEELKTKLATEGLFDLSRKQPLPAWPRRLAIITSPTGAAIHDVLSVLSRRFPLLDVEILPTLVQGETAPPQLARLLRYASDSGRYDAVLLTRGGGSLEDLWAFNDERVVRAIAAVSIPVVSAIGHETDFTLADFVADVRAPTPSAAAELLVPDRLDLQRRLRADHARLQERTRHILRQQMQHIDRLALQLRAYHPRTRLTVQRQRQQDLNRRLQAVWRERLHRYWARLQRVEAALHATRPHQRLALAQDRLRMLAPRMRNASGHALQKKQAALQALSRAIEAVSPLATVARGYAILTRDDSGTLVNSVEQAAPGDRLRARVRDGELLLKVDRPSN
ncbi:MAG: exodeoxyribonuclease VII large subunit [Xanthomonadaceae bacterium]|jgi:exodeoxyribonuclease VII large subunit|nr:exodeoxyribonuclease VII large subunit [Xanthomonadaceae bacterium]